MPVPAPVTSTSMASSASVDLSQEVQARIKRTHQEALRGKEAFQAWEQNTKVPPLSFPSNSPFQHMAQFS